MKDNARLAGTLRGYTRGALDGNQPLVTHFMMIRAILDYPGQATEFCHPTLVMSAFSTGQMSVKRSEN